MNRPGTYRSRTHHSRTHRSRTHRSRNHRWPAAQLLNCLKCSMCWMCLICPRTHRWPAGPCFNIDLPSTCTPRQDAPDISSECLHEIQRNRSKLKNIYFCQLNWSIPRGTVENICMITWFFHNTAFTTLIFPLRCYKMKSGFQQICLLTNSY